MRNPIICICLFLFGISVYGQKSGEFQWSDLSQWKKEGLQNLNFVFPTESGFIAYSHEKPNSRFFSEKTYIHKFDNQGNGKIIAEFEVPKRLKRDAISKMILEGDEKLYFFSYLPMKKDGQNILYAQVYDNKTEKVSEPKELFSIPIKKSSNSGFFKVAISPNGQKICVLVNDLFVKKTKEKIKILNFNSDLTLESQNEFTLSFDSKRVYHETLFVSNGGVVSIVKKTDITKKRPVTTVISISNTEIKEQQVSGEKFYISDSQVHTINDQQYLIGFATDNARPSITYGGAKDNSYFIYNISESKLIKRKEWDRETIKKVLGKGYIGLKLQNVLFSGDDIFLIGDCYKQDTREVKDKKFVYDYIHNFGPGVAIKMKLNGEVDFEAALTYGDEYINQENRLSSMFPFVDDGQLYILANERYTKMKKVAIAGAKKIRARTMVLWSFDSEGKQVITPFWNSRVGRPDDVTIFAPTKTLQFSEGKFYIYSFGSKYHRFGSLLLE